MHYFSYGSNMSSRRLLARTPSATRLGIATLGAHELRFHKIGQLDGSAKCDARETGKPEHRVIGVLFILSEKEKQLLDKIEGLGKGYDKKSVLVNLESGEPIQAYTYYATHIDPDLKPFHWYKEHVLQGAREHGLPETYIQTIARVESIADHNLDRHARELAIYR